MSRIARTNPTESPLDNHGPEPICDDDPYVHVAPGNYEARCVHVVTYADKRYKRWVCRLTLRFIHSDAPICYFLNLGSGQEPKAGRGSEYRRAWIIANGDAPRRRQTLSPRVFKDKILLVRVEDVTKRFDGRDHLKSEVYSVVREVLQKMV